MQTTDPTQPDSTGMVLPGILRALAAEDLAALAAGGAEPAPYIEPSQLHTLLDLAVELSSLIRGLHETSLNWDALGVSGVSIRVDREDWPDAEARIVRWARLHVRPGDGDRVDNEPGSFLSLYLRRVGVVRCWSARLTPGGAS